MKKAPEFVQEENVKTILWRKNTEDNDATDVNDVDNVTDNVTEDVTEERA